MGVALDPFANVTPERKPGQFARHPTTGAPYVTDPTKTRQPTGAKPELIAKCEARGIEVPAKITVAQLKELLGPEMAMSQYGRPSSLGKQIENTTNLQKWSERAVALGVFLAPELFAELAELDDEHYDLSDTEARTLLDAIAVQAKNIAQAGIAAERGTHTHALTEDHDEERDWVERARQGEDLGIPVEAQLALVRAWERCVEVNDLEILEVETMVVDDLWRQAGTLDRIARLRKGLTFHTPDGEIVVIPGGTVIVLDVKTGRLRCEGGIVQYWAGYAVQIASYAQAVPYDPDTGLRSEWPYEVAQDYALIAHLDVLAALDGAATCRLVLVDLAAGREAGERCVWARRWEKRTDVFSLVTDADDTCVVVDVEIAEPSIDSIEEVQPPESVSAPAPDSGNIVELPETFYFEVVGLTFVDAYPQNLQILAKSGKGQPVELIRNPDNPHDANAVEVHVPSLGTLAFVGHADRDAAASMAPHLDAGVMLVTTVEEVLIDPAHPDKPGLQIRCSAVVEVEETVMVLAADVARELAESTTDWHPNLRKMLGEVWPPGLATPRAVRAGEATWTHAEMIVVRACLDEIVGPLPDVSTPVPNRWAPDEPDRVEPAKPMFDDGDTLAISDVDVLIAAIKASPVRLIVNGWLSEAAEIGQTWHPGKINRVRQYEITRAALALALIDEQGDGTDSTFLDVVRLILATVTFSTQPEMPTNPIGVILASLTTIEATAAHDVAARLTGGALLLTFTDQGHPVLTDTHAATAA